MRLAVSLFVATLLATAIVTAAPAEVSAGKPSLAALGKEYRALRKVAGWFSNGGKEWNEAVDSAGGRKEMIMGELGARLGDGKSTRRQVVRIMGKPDEIAHDGDMSWGLATPPAGTTELLVYEWRGGHDWLWFAVTGKQVTASGWWMALE
jgi:hypothetical protein